MNIPNRITLSRIALVPFFVILMSMDAAADGASGWRIAAIAVFIAAASTDWMDGYVARKRNEVTSFGKFVDPLADKLLVAAALLHFVGEGIMADWAALVILGREFIVASLRMVASGGGTVIAAGFSGKLKTLTQILLIIVMLTPVRETLLSASGGIRLCDICSWVMTAVTVWSGADYLWRYRAVLRGNLR